MQHCHAKFRRYLDIKLVRVLLGLNKRKISNLLA